MNNQAINGASDLYLRMVEVSKTKNTCVAFTKKQARELGVKWSFVEASAEILNLKVQKAGQHGFLFTGSL